MLKPLRLFCIAVIALAVARSHAQITAPEARITFNLENVFFPQACEALVGNTDLNLLAELHLVHEPFATVRIQNKPVGDALLVVAALFQREVIPAGRTMVMRSPRWAYRRVLDRQTVEQGSMRWSPEGRLEVKVQKLPAGMMRLDVHAYGVSVSRLVQELTKQTGWGVQVEKHLQNLRVFARWRGASPSEILEALTVLLNGAQEVVIRRSEEAKRQEEEQIAQMQDRRPPHEKGTETLLPELLKLLTPEELAQYERGERVEISTKRIPTELFPQVMEYAAGYLHWLRSLISSEEAKPPADLLTEANEFFLVLPYPPYNRTIGIRAYDRSFNGFWSF